MAFQTISDADNQEYTIFNLGGLNTYINPFNQTKGQFFRLLNVDPLPYGAKTKRAGYVPSLDNPDSSQIKSLFAWQKNDGTSIFVYRASGSILYYYDAAIGTAGNWSICGNGTIGQGAHVGYAVLNDTLIIGDGVTNTRHSTNGTSFTDTTLAPKGQFFAEYQQRVYIMGTASTLFYSTTGDATNWNTSGTSDSSSIDIPGAGKGNGLFKSNDRLIIDKNSGNRFRWDGDSLVDLATNLAYTSPYSLGTVEDYKFGINRMGVFGFNGANPEIVSNSIQNEIYNDQGSGIPAANFDSAAGVAHRYDYYISMGTIKDDFTNYQIPDAIGKYNYQQNTWSNQRFFTLPTAWLSYKDRNLQQQLLFGDAYGQCWLYGGTATTDNGNPIEAQIGMFVHGDMPQYDKEWRIIRLYFNPGCQAQVQIAATRTFNFPQGGWKSIGDVSAGIVEYHCPADTRGNFLWVLIKESSKASRFCWYGMSINFNVVPNK